MSRNYIKLIFDCSGETAFFGYNEEIYNYKFESVSADEFRQTSSTVKQRYTYGGLYRKYIDSSTSSTEQYYKSRCVYTVSSLDDISSPKETYTYPIYWELSVVVNPNRRYNNSYYGSLSDVPDYCGTGGAEFGNVFSIFDDNGGLVASVFYLPKDN